MPVPENLTDHELVEAVETNLISMFREVKLPEAYGEPFAEPNYFQVVTDFPGAIFNSIAGASLEADTADEVIEMIISRGRARGVPMLWWVGPVTQPTDLGDRLQRKGFSLTSEIPAMVLDLLQIDETEPLPQGMTIEEVHDLETHAIWVEVLTRGFGMPETWQHPMALWMQNAVADPNLPMHNYLGYYNGEPVATASVYLGPKVAGIYNIATLESARGKGIGRAITLKALFDARTKGYRYSMLHSSEMGYSVYKKIGYRDVSTIYHYVWSPDSDQP